MITKIKVFTTKFVEEVGIRTALVSLLLVIVGLLFMGFALYNIYEAISLLRYLGLL